jgi:hypothetical protein
MSTTTVPVTGIATQETTFFGATISGTINVTPHVWTANASGLFTTTADLATEWKTYYDTMMAGNADTLTFVQRLEGNAEAVFENTGLSNLSTATQARDRMDAQREFDAISATMSSLGLDPYAALTQQSYLQIENALQSNASLEELAMQGHGLNSPSDPKYNGFTNDFQNNTDNTTLYIGGGFDNNETAVPNLFDDVILSHLPFPSVMQNGTLEQLNQNAAAEDPVSVSVAGLDEYGAGAVLTAADFSTTPGTASSTVPPAPPSPKTPAPAGEMYALSGALVSTSVTIDGHTWTAGPDGLYTTTADLASEWAGYYTQMVDGQGASLTAIQRWEGNAEAAFLYTGLAKLATTDATTLAYDMMDVQREIDAVSAIMTQLGLGSAPLTDANYLAIEQALQDNPANAIYEELGIQGHGLNDPVSSTYNGFTNDFQNNVDQATLYVGPGLDSGERALADFFDDAIMTHLPFASAAQNGKIEQLNQNGTAEDTVQASVDSLNQTLFTTTYVATDFNVPGTVPVGDTTAPAGTITTFYGTSISNAPITIGAHTWTLGTDGTYHTTTNLQAEWEGYYQIMLAGNGASLTFEQRWEGNAEAVFDNTTLSGSRYNAAAQQKFREDAQREMDAVTAIMEQLGLGSAPLSTQDYLNIETALQDNATLEELAMQGHGLNNQSLTKYQGFTNQFQNNTDNTTYFIGGGEDNGEKAVADLFDDAIMTHLPFPTVSINGVLTQLNQNGDQEDPVTQAVALMNQTLFQQVYVAGDFSKTATGSGPIVYVSAAAATAVAPAAPTPGPGQMLSFTGQVVPTTIVANGHTWVADSSGRYETTTDLTLEWYNAYEASLTGAPLTLTQHWEANAEAVFINTNLAQQSEGQQAIDRADVQREIDAVVTVMNDLGLGSGPLTEQQYLQDEQALQSNAALGELAVQGIGLNNPYVAGVTEYNGYTMDFQYSGDGQTLYVGGGLSTGEKAVSSFFSDSIMTWLPFQTIAQNGEVLQLNQNGNANITLPSALAALNATLFTRLYTAADFMTPGRETPLPSWIGMAPARTPTPGQAPGPASVTTLFGSVVASPVTVNGDTWTADVNGTFQTSSPLEMQWRADYQTMLAGNGASLTVAQRMAGNAEAVFENSAIDFSWMGAAKEAMYREDVQRMIDAIAGAMQIDQTLYGIDPNAPLTEASYLQLGETIRSNPVLEELAMQGVGVPGTNQIRYRGAYADFMAGADWSTYFVGGGSDNGELAVPYMFNDVISYLAFPAANIGGVWEQLDRNGNVAETAVQAAAALNNTMFYQVYVAADFSKTASTVGPVVPVSTTPVAPVITIASETAPAGEMVTLSGQLIATTQVINGHTWTADSNGLFHTTNLAAEWTADYQAMLSGNTAGMNAIQMLEGNAEAVFEATGLTSLSGAVQQQLREDVQRDLDAMAGAFTLSSNNLGLPTSPTMLAGSYVAMEQNLQDNAVLEELAVQGMGLTTAPAGEQIRYSGWINDIKPYDKGMKFIGGGIDNNRDALTVFMEENVMSWTPFAVIWKNGKLMQLNQNGQTVDSMGNAIQALADTAFNRVYRKANF